MLDLVSILILIPTYNEADNIAVILGWIKDALKNSPTAYEIGKGKNGENK